MPVTIIGDTLSDSLLDKLHALHAAYGRGVIKEITYDKATGAGVVYAMLQYGASTRTFTIDTAKMRLRYLGHVRTMTPDEL